MKTIKKRRTRARHALPVHDYAPGGGPEVQTSGGHIHLTRGAHLTRTGVPGRYVPDPREMHAAELLASDETLIYCIGVLEDLAHEAQERQHAVGARDNVAKGRHRRLKGNALSLNRIYGTQRAILLLARDEMCRRFLGEFARDVLAVRDENQRRAGDAPKRKR